MAKITIDFTGVKVGFEAAPAGYYKAKVTNVELGVSKKGDPKLVWEFTITEPEEFEGRKQWLHTSLNKDARWKVKETLIALGFPEEELTAEEELDTEMIIGLDCILVLEETEYDGKPSTQISEVLPDGELPEAEA